MVDKAATAAQRCRGVQTGCGWSISSGQIVSYLLCHQHHALFSQYAAELQLESMWHGLSRVWHICSCRRIVWVGAEPVAAVLVKRGVGYGQGTEAAGGCDVCSDCNVRSEHQEHALHCWHDAESCC